MILAANFDKRCSTQVIHHFESIIATFIAALNGIFTNALNAKWLRHWSSMQTAVARRVASCV